MDKAKLFQSMSKSKSSLHISEDHREYPINVNDYELLKVCGTGVSGEVWKAKCKPLDEIVAVKILDLESLNCKMEEVIHEAQLMCLYNHPNVLSLYTSFVTGQHLWFVMPFVAGGSVLNIMRYKYPNGLDELVIAIIMKEVAKALEYVHRFGGIHRDVKAGNILIGLDGSVKLADFGVAATMERGGSWGNDKISRKTFVGTPCWMAPEVMEQKEGYDVKADIWSFGITLLELAHGHAPFAKYPPMKVLLMTLHNPPPQLEDTAGQRHFTKNMRELVAACLQKDPAKRPTAVQISESKFFKNIPDTKYLVSHLLDNLPMLTERMRIQTESKSAKSLYENKEDLIKAKEDYVKGVSGWNFDLASLKAVADNVGTSQTKSPLPTVAEHIEELSEAFSARETEEGVMSPISSDDLLSPTKRLVAASSSKGTNAEKNGTAKQSRFLVINENKSAKEAETKGAAPEETKAESKVETLKVETRTVDVKHEEKTKANGTKSESLSVGVQKPQSSKTIDETLLVSDLNPDASKLEIEETSKVETNVYSISRFKVIEQNVKKDVKVEKAKAVTKHSSQGDLNMSGKQAASPEVCLLSPKAMQQQLEVILKGYYEQGAAIQKLVDALGEADKAKAKTLQALPVDPQPLKLDSKESLENRIKELENENKALREKNIQYQKLLASKGLLDNGLSPTTTTANANSNCIGSAAIMAEPPKN